jgi:hypothetical protein
LNVLLVRIGKEAATSHVKIMITVSGETREREKLLRNNYIWGKRVAELFPVLNFSRHYQLFLRAEV